MKGILLLLLFTMTNLNMAEVQHSKVNRTEKTVLNFTHHSFINLHGAGKGTINDHELMILADKFTLVNESLIPIGELLAVQGTPMDFQQPVMIGKRVDDNYEQLKFGNGYDHNWVLKRKTSNETELAATIYEPKSGRYIEVWTTEPGIQFYGGNFFAGSEVGKDGEKYEYRASLALETQHFPDSPNHPSFPSTVLNPDETYKHICIYKYSNK